MMSDEKNTTPEPKKLKPSNSLTSKGNQFFEFLKRRLTAANSLMEYFVIIGLDPKFSSESYLYHSSLEDLENFYSTYLKPEIITKFPPINKSYINIDDNLSEACFPKGFKLEKHETEPNPEVLKFILGNYFYSINYPLKYITCLKIYESLEKYYLLYKKINDTFGKNKVMRKNSNYLPLNNIINDMELDIDKSIKKTVIQSRKSDDNLRIIVDQNNDIIKESEFNKYYFPKIICFVSLNPFFKYQEKILYQIYEYYKGSDKLDVPLEKIILNILCNIQVPPRGVIQFSYQLNEKFDKINLETNKMNQLKKIDDDLLIALKYFNVDDLIEIFKYVLFETKTIIFGTNNNDICTFIHVLMSILFPFEYPFQVTSYLNKSAFEILESVPPYLVGINQKFSENFFKENKIEIKESNILIIDLDNKEFIMKYIEELPNIPKSFVKKLKTNLESNINKNKKNSKDENEENWICYPFFEFFLNILYNYREFLDKEKFKTNYRISSLKNVFKIKEFIESHSNSEKPFYKKLCETQMFNDFIFKNMIPKNVDDQLNILFFDENLNKRNNKKIFSKKKAIILLNSKEYDYNQIFKVPIIKELSNEEKKRYNDKQYIDNNLLLG